jgi:hypothetical protein
MGFRERKAVCRKEMARPSSLEIESTLTAAASDTELALHFIVKGQTMRNVSISLSFLLVTSVYVVAQSVEQRKDIRAGTSAQSESLRGLKGVSLTVDLFDRDGAMDASERRAALKVLQDDARAQIEKAGIRLLNAMEIEDAGSPHLSMVLSMRKPSNFSYPLVSELQLFQQANLRRDSSVEMSLVTWKADGAGGPEVNLAMLRSQLSSLFDRFIKDYLAANHK